jgi:gamma-glutamylcyclotransferase (GGCT)/AIG2-like uncharacterized protein YtfP
MLSTQDDRLFVYGTLRKERNHQMYRVLARYAIYVGDGSIRGELYDLGEYPGVMLPENCPDTVFGEVYELRSQNASQAWRELDEYEGCGPADPEPQEYERRWVPVTLTDGTETNAWAYVLHALPTRAVRVPSGDYLTWRQRQRQQNG